MARTRPPFAVEKPVFESLERFARELRLQILETAQKTKRVLPAEALSVADILIALYWQSLKLDPKYPDNPVRDRFLFGIENLALAHYCALGKRGFFPAQELDHFDEPGSRLPLSPSPLCVPGIEWACNNAASALSVGSGFALSSQIQSHGYNVFVLVDENSCQEGSLWEAAALSARLNLSNLIAVVSCRSRPAERTRAAARSSLSAKWQSQGWNVREVDGHDINGMIDALQPKKGDDSPLAVIASTVRGRGFSLTEAEAWNDRILSAEDVESAKKELFP
jgi:transketolase